MSYAVEYHFGVTAIKPIVDHSKSRRSIPVRILCLLLILTIFLSAFLICRTDFLVPGDKEVTKAAFRSLLQTVEDGTDIQSAVTAFCKEVIDGAKLP